VSFFETQCRPNQPPRPSQPPTLSGTVGSFNLWIKHVGGRSPQPKRHLDISSCFTGHRTVTDKQTDRQTNRQTTLYSVCNNRPHLRSTTMRSNNGPKQMNGLRLYITHVYKLIEISSTVVTTMHIVGIKCTTIYIVTQKRPTFDLLCSWHTRSDCDNFLQKCYW